MFATKKGMGPHAPSFTVGLGLTHKSVLVVMSVAGTLTLNAKSRTALFTAVVPTTVHVSDVILSAFPFPSNHTTLTL